MIERVIVAGGGTGGHLFPGIAVIEELKRRHPGLEVTYVGTERGIEARVIPQMGERLELIDVKPLKGRSAGQLVMNVMRLPGAATQAMAVVRRHRPDLVIGVGGYASGPILAAAAALGVPTAVLEQNAHVGMTNRMLSKVVGRAYLTFAETASSFARKKARVVGNPVRRAFVDAARRAATDPDGFEARAKRIFVLGGSQGARALNQTVPEALARLDLAEKGVTVLHQTGTAMQGEVAARYDQLGIDAEVVPFIDDMASAYAGAALVIARAGASTVAELCAIGRPSILVPYPFAADDHQGKNAEAVERAGAGVCVREERLEVEALADTVRVLLDDDARRRAMADAARTLGRPDAAAAIVDDLCEWLGCPEEAFVGEADGGPTAGDEPKGGGGDGEEGGGQKLRRSRPDHLPYEPRVSLSGARRHSSAPPGVRPELMVGWDA